MKEGWWPAVAVLLLALTACSGSDDATSTAAEPAGTGDGDLVIGSIVDLPEWFPEGFAFPDDLRLRSVSRDPSNDLISLVGQVPDADPASVMDEMVTRLQDAGFEFLTDTEGIAVFIREGIGRVRVRAAEIAGETTLNVDIDTWSDDQLDEVRALFAEEAVVPGRAMAQVGGTGYEAEGECRTKGDNHQFFAADASITLQVDNAADPPTIYADVTTDDGVVYVLDETVEPDAEASPERMSASGTMTEFGNEDAGPVKFSIDVNCDA